MRRLLVTIIIGILFVFGPKPTLAQCHPSPDLSIMDNNFLLYLKNLTLSEKNKVAILPFFDNQAGNPDFTLFFGTPFVIYDMFSDQAPMIHPYLSYHALSDLAINSPKIADIETAKMIAKKLEARFVIFGSFQVTFNKTIRVLINLYDDKTGKALSPAVSFETAYDDAYFNQLRIHVVKVFEQTKSAQKLKVNDDKIPSMLSFRYYSNGLQLAAKYNTANLNLATLWFEKALKESYFNYDEAILNLARAHFMTSLIEKLSKIDSSQSWANGVKALDDIKHKPKKLTPKYLMTYRFLDAQDITKNAITAYMTKKNSEASKFAEEGLNLVPEDGILQNLYLVTSGGSKNKEVEINNPVCF